MAIDITNLVQGPARVYYGAYGATEPADSAVGSAPSSPTWTDLGATEEGLTLTTNREHSKRNVDQVLWPVDSIPTDVDVQFKTSLAEATLTNLSYALNSGTVTTSASYETYDPDYSELDFQPTYYALIFDGPAPGSSKRRRVIARRVLAIDTVESKYVKDAGLVYTVTWRAHYIDSSTAPIHYVDEL